jgi:hypothetical protein
MKKMNELLEGDYTSFFRDPDSALGRAVAGDWIRVWEHTYEQPVQRIQLEDKPIWRLEAFLHDVGKAFANSKHASRGLWLVAHLSPDESGRVRSIFGEANFRHIQRVIACHERFGVVNTGESSYGIFADMLGRGTTEADVTAAKKSIFHILALNIIDTSATQGFDGRLASDKIQTFLHDWNVCFEAVESPLQRSKGDRGRYEAHLLELASRTESLIDRMSRLLRESYDGALQKLRKEDPELANRQRNTAEIDFRELAGDALEPQLGFRFDDFRADFAYVVKFDYLLSLTKKIAYNHLNPLSGETREMRDLAVCLVGVVKKLLEQFSDLIHRGESRSRIGIDLSVLRMKENEKAQDRIAELLSGPLAGLSFGLEWLAEEATAWPF